MINWNSLWRAYREKPYRNIFIALGLVILFDATAPNEYARGRFADLMLVGIFSGTMFGVSAVCYRASSLSLGGEGFLTQPAFTLACVTVFQAALMGAYLRRQELGQFTAELANNGSRGL